MQDTEFKLGDRVIVSAAVTGYGEDMHGVVSDVEVFAKGVLLGVCANCRIFAGNFFIFPYE